MRKFIVAGAVWFALAIAAVSSALALAPVDTAALWQNGTHDGISLDFTKSLDACCYVRTPGQPAQRNNFQAVFSFARNSVGTFLGSNGVTQYANENQFQQSQTFDNAYWTKTASSITADATTAPDGTLTADKLVEDSASTFHLVQRSASTTGLVHTISIYAKAAERQWLLLCVGNGTDCAYFNTSTGAVGTVTGAAITNVWNAGGGWYRISLTGTAFANTNAQYLLANANGSASYQGDGVSGMYIWGAQLQYGRNLGPLLTTTTAAKYDQPRIEYDTSGNLLGLLIEGARTNAILQSEDQGTTWVQNAMLGFGSGSTLNSTATLDPAGSNSADLLTPTTASTVHNNQQTFTATSATWTLSAYVKPNGYTKVGFAEVNATAQYATFLLTGAGSVIEVAGSTTATIAAQTNGWYRISMRYPGTAASHIWRTYILDSSYASGTPAAYNYAGNGTSGMFFWGFQAEVGGFVSSYIPTAASAVTRAADVATRTFGSEVSLTTGTTVAEFDFTQVNAAASQFIFSTNANGRFLYNPSGAVTVAIFDGTTAAGAGTFSSGVMAKGASAYGDSTMVMVVGSSITQAAFDGSMVGTAAVGLGQSGAGGNELFGHIRRLDYWPVKLPQSSLIQKTQPGPQSALKWPTYAANDNSLRRAG